MPCVLFQDKGTSLDRLSEAQNGPTALLMTVHGNAWFEGAIVHAALGFNGREEPLCSVLNVQVPLGNEQAFIAGKSRSTFTFVLGEAPAAKISDLTFALTLAGEACSLDYAKELEVDLSCPNFAPPPMLPPPAPPSPPPPPPCYPPPIPPAHPPSPQPPPIAPLGCPLGVQFLDVSHRGVDRLGASPLAARIELSRWPPDGVISLIWHGGCMVSDVSGIFRATALEAPPVGYEQPRLTFKLDRYIPRDQTFGFHATVGGCDPPVPAPQVLCAEYWPSPPPELNC